MNRPWNVCKEIMIDQEDQRVLSVEDDREYDQDDDETSRQDANAPEVLDHMAVVGVEIALLGRPGSHGSLLRPCLRGNDLRQIGCAFLALLAFSGFLAHKPSPWMISCECCRL
jgi:hypothetical protein